MMYKYLLNLVILTISTTILANNNAIINNAVTVKKSRFSNDNLIGQINLELNTGKFELPPQEWALSETPIIVKSGYIYINRLSGHWQKQNLPKSCLKTIKLGGLMSITGNITNTGNLKNLKCEFAKINNHNQLLK